MADGFEGASKLPKLKNRANPNMDQLTFGHIAGGAADSLLGGALINFRGNLRNMFDPRMALAQWAAGNPMARQVQNIGYNIQYRRTLNMKPFENPVGTPRANVNTSFGTAAPVGSVQNEMQRALVPTNNLLHQIHTAVRGEATITQGGFSNMLHGMAGLRSTTGDGLRAIHEDNQKVLQSLEETAHQLASQAEKDKFNNAEKAEEHGGVGTDPTDVTDKPMAAWKKLGIAAGAAIALLATKTGREFVEITAIITRIFKALRDRISLNTSRLEKDAKAGTDAVKGFVGKWVESTKGLIKGISESVDVGVHTLLNGDVSQRIFKAVMKPVDATVAMYENIAKAVKVVGESRSVAAVTEVGKAMKPLARLVGELAGLSLYLKASSTAIGETAKVVEKGGSFIGKLSKVFSALLKFGGEISGLTRFAKIGLGFAKAIPLVGEFIIAITTIFDGIKGFIRGWKQTKGNTIDKLFGGLWGALMGIVKGIVEPFAMLANWIKDGVAKVMGFFGFKDLEKKMEDFDIVKKFDDLMDKIPTPADAGKRILELILNLIRKFAAGAAAAAGHAADHIAHPGRPPEVGKGDMAALDAIGAGETGDYAKHGLKSAYDATIGYGEGWRGVKPPPRATDAHGNQKALTDMTYDEVMNWQKQYIAMQKKAGIPENQRSAVVGRYQFTYANLLAYQKKLNIAGGTKFDANLQNTLGVAHMNANGYSDFKAGKISPAELTAKLRTQWPSIGARYNEKFYMDAFDKARQTSPLPASNPKAAHQANQMAHQNAAAGKHAPVVVNTAHTNTQVNNTQVNNGAMPKSGSTRYDRQPLDGRH